MIGGKKTVPGKDTVTGADATPAIVLTARSRTLYVVPLVSPVIVTGLVVSAGDSEVHSPKLSKYW